MAVISFLAIVYFAAGKLGLRLAFVHASATAVWPPTGIALAALLVLGYRVWPGILLGAFLVNLTTAGSVATSIGIAAGNTLEGLVGAYLVNRFAGGRNPFAHAQDVFKFAVLAGILSTTISPSFGVTSLSLGGFTSWANYGSIWLTWWLGDAAGALVVAPLLLIWSATPRVRWSPGQALEAAALLLCLFLVGLTVFGELIPSQNKNYPLEFLCIPFLIWAAYRFGQREASTAILVLSAVAIGGTLHGFGPFVRETQNESLLLLLAFMGVIATMTIALAAVVSEREQSEEALRRAHNELELQVQQRTKELSSAMDALRENEARLRRLVESNVIGIILADASGRITLANDAFLKMVGYTLEEVVAGKLRWDEMTPPHDRDQDAQAVEELMRSGGYAPFEKELIRKNGTRVHVLVGSAALAGSKGNIDCVGFVLDISDRKRAETSLRESEERFRLLVEGVKDYAIFMLDASGRVASWNLGAERLKGYTAEEVIGDHCSRFYLSEDLARGKPEQLVLAAMAEGRVEDEGWRVRKDGSRFWANVVITALHDSSGNLRGFTEITRDITERRRAEESRRAIEERFRAVAETANDAIVSADSRGHISYFNSSAERIFGYPAVEVLGQPLTVLMPERFHEAHGRGFARFLSTGESRVVGKTIELVGKRKDGSEFPLELSLATWKTGEQIFFTAVIRDIAGRRQAEAALEQQAAELVRFNTELAAANKELEAFTYSVSHDLRAPLRHVDGFSKILLEEFGPQLDSSAQHCLQRIQEGVRQMGRLVDDLLNLGRVGRQTLSVRHSALKPMVLEALTELKPETAGREIEWRIGDLPTVECDPGLLKLVFTNLLSNAIKFTRSQKRAVIEVGEMTVEGQSVIFVRDNGIGFNMRYVHKLFGIFQRLHRQEDFEGTGVGLANVQRIVQKHGGRVWAEGEPYKGATFYFSLARANGPEINATVRGGAWQTTR